MSMFNRTKLSTHRRERTMFCKYPAILGLLIQLNVIGFGQSQSPCPDVFNYARDPSTGNIIGLIEIRKASKGAVQHIRVLLSVAAKLPTEYVGKVEYAFSGDQAIEDVSQGRPLHYRIQFPIQKPLPLITRILLNEQEHCIGQGATGSYVTTITLDYVMTISFSVSRPPQSSNPSSYPVKNSPSYSTLNLYSYPSSNSPSYPVSNPSSYSNSNLPWYQVSKPSPHPDPSPFYDSNSNTPSYQVSKPSPHPNPSPFYDSNPNTPSYQVSKPSPHSDPSPFYDSNPNPPSYQVSKPSPHPDPSPFYDSNPNPPSYQVSKPSPHPDPSPFYDSNPNTPSYQVSKPYPHPDPNPFYDSNPNTPSYQVSKPYPHPDPNPFYDSNPNTPSSQVSKPSPHPNPSPFYDSNPNTPSYQVSKPSPHPNPSPFYDSNPNTPSYQVPKSSYPVSDPPSYPEVSYPAVSNSPSAPQRNNADFDKCGQRRNDFIAQFISNGETTERGDWPWLVALFVDVDYSLQFQCAGSLITNEHVLTAAHCLESSDKEKLLASTLLAAVGRYKLNSWTETGSDRVEVSDYTIHYEYGRGGGFGNDLAVLKLKEAVTFGDFIVPICLWEGSTDVRNIVGQSGIVVGWGQDEDGNPVTEEPRMITVPIVSQENCLRSNEDFVEITSERTFCAGARNGSGPCNGDSGAGLVMYDSQKQRYNLRGVVSLSLPDLATRSCDLSHFVVYTDAAKYLDWIQEQIAS